MLNFKFKDENLENVKAAPVNIVVFSLLQIKIELFIWGGGTRYIVALCSKSNL